MTSFFICATIFQLMNLLLELLCSAGWVRIVASTDILAQASLSRLGENSRKWPRLVLELELKRRAFVLSEKASHSSERVSPKRELVARRSRPSENSRTLLCVLLAVSPKRGLAA
ncbi:hypothetical protein DEO72_LG5g1718 [Vigna unguiculata]|uniref:Secreted protein n=1 Tax=Vigna unguiculata TaxID=3917 RepID=A0A4D6LXL3_VIGUN|nr:hypothetical protein DEO72_LG5g1718 [Vigna unguiculata]